MFIPEALTYVILSSTLFVSWWLLVNLEERRGQRLILRSARIYLDRVVVRVGEAIENSVHYITRHVIQLSWYYSLHAFLKTCLRLIAGTYHFFEAWLHHNRRRARLIRAERFKSGEGSFSEVAEHKRSVSLSEEEKKQLRHEHLER